MPDVDGFDLLRALRARNVQVPAIAVTAFSAAADRGRALAAGYAAYFVKPVDPQDFLNGVASLLGPARPERPDEAARSKE